MPNQTTLTDYIYFPDGAQVSIDTAGLGSFTDLGAISSATTAALNYDVNQFETANAGKLERQIRNMTIAGGFTLINLNIANIVSMGGGLFTSAATAGSELSAIPDQTIAAAWTDNKLYPLDMETTSTDDTKLKMATQPVLTSVTLNHGTPEVLVEDTDYVVVADSNSYSGWSFQFISGNMDSAAPTTYSITVVYGANTPVASTTLYCGSSTATLTAYAMKIKHTDSNSKVRELNLFAVDMDSGAFAFNFKGANEDGVQEMPLVFTAKINSDLTDGRQLMSFKVDTGAA